MPVTKHIPQALEQLDNHHFCITWNNAEKHIFHLNSLQMYCPCAACAVHPPSLNSDVRALRLYTVGSYALRIVFTGGCSHGLYDYDMLYRFGSKGI
jgi:DUF971 family protein